MTCSIQVLILLLFQGTSLWLIVIAAIYLRLMYRIRMFKIRYDHNTRMNSDAIEDEEYKAHFNKLIKCSDLLIECREIFRCGLAKLSNRYYYA